jgi:hypothetical protein
VVRDVMMEILLRDPASKPTFVASNQADAPSAVAVMERPQ